MSETYRTNETDNMIIRQIRNATLKITYAGYTFLTDHWLSDKGTGFSARTVIPEMAGLKTPPV